MTQSDRWSTVEIDGDESREPDPMAALPAASAVGAAADGLLDVVYRTIDTPLGGLLLAATRVGLLRVAFSPGHDGVLAGLEEGVGARVFHQPPFLDGAAHQLDEYFAGRRTEFELALDFRLSSGFRRDVLEHLQDISYGNTATYAQVAAAAGNAKAVRAVGTACATNPLPVVVPCHRVVRSDGTIGGYAGGSEAKRTLLELERSTVQQSI